MKTKVLPVNYTDDLENITMSERGLTAVGIEQMSITYTQLADTCSSSDDTQIIIITTQCAESCGIEEAEKQEGFYFDITIPEGHWSVDDGDSLKTLIDDFKKRLYMTNEFDNQD